MSEHRILRTLKPSKGDTEMSAGMRSSPQAAPVREGEPPYDSRPDTWAHISRVRELLGEVARNVIRRSDAHDRSKLVEPELAIFNEVQMLPRLRDRG